MAIKKLYIGSFGPYPYDDTDDIDDVDGDFVGETRTAIITDGYIKSEAVPSADEDMIRKKELTDHSDATSGVHGVTGDIVGTSDAQEITNKNYGGAVNYSAFSADGVLSMTGDARVKKEIEIFPSSFAPGVSGASRVLTGYFDGWSFDIDDDMVATFEVLHDWDPTTNLELKVYWFIDEAYATGSGEIQWKIDWAAVPTDDTEAIDSPNHSGTIDFGDQDIPATAKYLTKSIAGNIAAASISEGDLIGIKLSRIDLDDGSDPTADPVVVRIEVEYTSNKLGEAL